MRMSPASRGLPDFEYTLPAALQDALADAEKLWEAGAKTARLWAKDASLWTGQDESEWLEWLTIVDRQLAAVSKFKAFAAEIAEDAFQHFVLLGVGGSSLCPQVFAQTFGKQPNAPELLVLDSMDPAQIKALRDKIDPARSLFCVSSKSGTTLEPNICMQYFYAETKKIAGDSAGRHFIAFTDPGSKMEDIAASPNFRAVFHGVPAIGGGFSALSDFGMVPNAGMGLDTELFLKCTAPMVTACQEQEVAENPGVQLGLILGTSATKFGRDKVTFICSASIYALGAWLESVSVGLIPVDREPLSAPDEYGEDRIFVYIRFAGDSAEALDAAVEIIEASGQPVIRLVLHDLYQLGQVFFQWEMAAAVAAAVIGINPFKTWNRELTEAFETAGSLPAETPMIHQDGIKLFTDAVNSAALMKNSHMTLGGVIRAHIDRLQAGDYFGFLAYLPMFPEYEDKLQEIRKMIVEQKHVATVLGFRPRFPHSPNSGVFLQITCEEAADLPVPGSIHSFGIVKAAQARADFSALADRKRRILRVHLGKDIGAGLDRLLDLVAAGLAH